MTAGKEKKIKTLFITKWFPNREDPQLGIFIKKHALAVALYADVSLIYISPFNPEFHVTDFYISEEKNVRQYFFYYRNSGFRLLNLIRYYLAMRKGWKAVLKNSGRPDIIHAHVLTRTGVVAFLMSWEHNIPYLITEHWTGFANNKFIQKPGWYKWITRFVVSRASFLVVVSHKLKQAMANTGFKNSIVVIPNVVDLPMQPLTENKPALKKMFLTVADLLDEQKNISATLNVVSKIAKKRNDFEFHIIGGGPDEKMLQSHAEQLGIKDTFVFFHGQKANEGVYDFLSKVNFVVVNSLTETFSVVTAEALACGKPVIATISGGPEEILTVETGILIEKGNEVQLESAILQMLDNFENYKPQMLQDAVSGRYSSEKIGNSIYEIYQNVLKEREEGI